MQKLFQGVGFLAGLGVFGVGIAALFMRLGESSRGSFKIDGLVEFTGDSTAIVFVLVGAFLMVASAGWFRTDQKADAEEKKKLVVARDLAKYVQASKPLLDLGRSGSQGAGLTPELKSALSAHAIALSPESQAVLDELQARER